MVAVNNFNYILEIKNEHDENLLYPIRLNTVYVQPSHNINDLIDARGGIYSYTPDNRGYIKTTFLAEGNDINFLMSLNIGFNLCVKPSYTSESYVYYKNCVPIGYQYFASGNALLEYDITWYYARSEHVLTPPRELLGEELVDLNMIRVSNQRYRNYYRPPAENAITQVNWKESGF